MSFVNELVILHLFTDKVTKKNNWSNVICVCYETLLFTMVKEIHAFLNLSENTQFYLRNEISPMSSSPVTVISRDLNTSIHQSWIVINNAEGQNVSMQWNSLDMKSLTSSVESLSLHLCDLWMTKRRYLWLICLFLKEIWIK